jgi:hypothetical protein
MLCGCERIMTGFMCSGLLSCKLGTVSSGSTRGVQFLDQLINYEDDQKDFVPQTALLLESAAHRVGQFAYCVDVRIPSQFRTRSTEFKQTNLKQMSVNIFVMTPVQISPGTVATADNTLELITDISLASTKLIKLISWRKHKYIT